MALKKRQQQIEMAEIAKEKEMLLSKQNYEKKIAIIRDNSSRIKVQIQTRFRRAKASANGEDELSELQTR